MLKVLDELHKIREKIYQEEKELSEDKVLEKLHKRVKKILKERKLHLKQVERKIVKV